MNISVKPVFQGKNVLAIINMVISRMNTTFTPNINRINNRKIFFLQLLKKKINAISIHSAVKKLNIWDLIIKVILIKIIFFIEKKIHSRFLTFKGLLIKRNL